MELREFQLVDLGVFPRGSDVELFGAGFRDLPDIMLADGATAKEAFANLLNDLATEGLGTNDVSRAGRAMHLESPDAETPVEELVDPEDESTKDTECAYYVGIRFLDPRDPIDVEEVDDDDDEDDEEEEDRP